MLIMDSTISGQIFLEQLFYVFGPLMGYNIESNMECCLISTIHFRLLNLTILVLRGIVLCTSLQCVRLPPIDYHVEKYF